MSEPTQSTQDLLKVRISRASDIIWEGNARSVSGKNSVGPFDILPLHGHFISILNENPIIVVEEKGEPKEYSFARSVMHVKDNIVNIYTDIV